jgi:hypothetical protein
LGWNMGAVQWITNHQKLFEAFASASPFAFLHSNLTRTNATFFEQSLIDCISTNQECSPEWSESDDSRFLSWRAPSVIRSFSRPGLHHRSPENVFSELFALWMFAQSATPILLVNKIAQNVNQKWRMTLNQMNWELVNQLWPFGAIVIFRISNRDPIKRSEHFHITDECSLVQLHRVGLSKHRRESHHQLQQKQSTRFISETLLRPRPFYIRM